MSITTYLGREWFYNTRDQPTGAQAKLLEDVKGEPHIYIEINIPLGRRYGVIRGEELAAFLSHNRHGYEIVPTTRKRKFYIEYDVEVPDTDQSPEEHERVFHEMQAKGVADAESVCGPGRAVLSGSWGKKARNIKYSLHVVRPDRFFPDHAAARAMPTIANSLGADPAVYTRNQHFKLPRQSKKGDLRVQNIITGDFMDHVLTYSFDPEAIEISLDIPVPPVAEVRTRSPRAPNPVNSIALAPWPTSPDTLLVPDNWAMTSCPRETLALIRHTKEPPFRIPRSTRYMIMGWCRHRGLELEHFLAWAWQGKEDTRDRRARYSAQWVAWANKRPPGDRKLLLVLMRLYPDIALDNKEARVYRQSHSLVTTRTVTGVQAADGQSTIEEVINGPRFLGIIDFGTERAALLHIPMARGKTTQIRGILERKDRSLILTHRQTLADDIYANVKRYGTTDLRHYAKDFGSTEEKSFMGQTNQLICQLESVYHLRSAEPYTYLMIDESQLLFLQAASKTFKTSDDVRLMWEALTYHIVNAKHVRLYDGFMGRISMDVLKGLGIANVSVVRMPDTVPNNGRTMFIKSVDRNMPQKDWLVAWAVDIGKQVAAGKNVMVFFHFNHETHYWPSMKQIMTTICRVGGIDMDTDTVMHYGGMDEEEKTLILSNIGQQWMKRVVMTNSAVTAGVDFTPRWFHRMYACVSGYNNPREIVQWLSRARNIIENKVYVVKISPRLKPDPLANRLEADPVYTNLMKSINTEITNTKKSVLECFAIDAGYVIKKDTAGFSDDVMKLVEASGLHRDEGMVYDNIETIDSDKAKFLRKRVAAHAATRTEKLCLDKFFFDILFREEVDAVTRGSFWDEGLIRAAHSMREFRKPGCNMHATLPEVCARIDDILSGAASCDPEALVAAAFADHIDQPTFKAIEERYPTHQRDCTSDKKFLNLVMKEACNSEIWRWNHKNKKWDVNKDKLEIMAELFASVRSDSFLREEREEDPYYRGPPIEDERVWQPGEWEAQDFDDSD